MYDGDETIEVDFRDRVAQINDYLAKKETKYLAGDNLTLVDFILYELIELTDLAWNHTLLSNFPALKRFHSTMDSIPQLVAYK